MCLACPSWIEVAANIGCVCAHNLTRHVKACTWRGKWDGSHHRTSCAYGPPWREAGHCACMCLFGVSGRNVSDHAQRVVGHNVVRMCRKSQLLLLRCRLVSGWGGLSTWLPQSVPRRYVNGHTMVVDGGAWLYQPQLVPREMVSQVSRGVEAKSRKVGTAAGRSKL